MQACFDQDGFLLWLSHHDREQQADANHIVIEVAEGSTANDLFWNGSQVVIRSDIAISADKPIIVSDGTDCATVTGLADPCWLRVNGQPLKVSGGSYTVRSNEPAAIAIEAIGEHSSEPIFIRSNTAQALMDEVRAARDALLLASDWTQGRDTVMSADKQAAWADYRAQLRDLPEQQPTANIATVEWPAKPS